MPHVGQRIVKTGFAVFLCLLVNRFLGYQGATMSAESVITAIICMQPYMNDSRTFALNRFSGTLIGTIWGMVFLFLLYGVPSLGQNFILLYALMAIGSVLAVYTAVVLNLRDCSGLSAIVFLCIVIQFPDIDSPHIQLAGRFLGVFIGTVVAITVNLFHLPRSKNTNLVFFVRAKDLAPDRFSDIPPAVLFHLNRLYEDGAKISILLEHAPAFFTMQMQQCHLNIPMIVMDGAAIFDTKENRYLYIEAIKRDASLWLASFLQDRRISFFTYHIYNNRTCILHNGELNESELLILKKMQQSPYRSYLIGEDELDADAVYFKIIDTEESLHLLERELYPFLASHHLRSVIRPQASAPGISGLYIYSQAATWERAQQYLMLLLGTVHAEELTVMNIFSQSDQYSEKNASRLLHRLIRAYEPVSFTKLFHRIKNPSS